VLKGDVKLTNSGGGAGVAYEDGQMGGRYKQGWADLADGRAGRRMAQIEPKSHVFDRVPSHLQTANRLLTLWCVSFQAAEKQCMVGSHV